jgi:DNA-binding CsgD family transcriptional regulator
MLLFSAMVMLMGVLLNIRNKNNANYYDKALNILTIANIISITSFLLNLSASPDSLLSIILTLTNATILVLNITLAYYVFKARDCDSASYAKLILRLFLISFASIFTFILLIYFSKSEAGFFSMDNKLFPINYGFVVLLSIWGSVIPGIKSILSISKRESQYLQINLLLILNMLNNAIGLFFFTLKFPSTDTSLIMNMLINLIFAYYLGYYLISRYFNEKKRASDSNLNTVNIASTDFKWNELKTHLKNWNETKSYLSHCNPALAEEAEKHPLSDLEKIHYCLKRLRITSKDVSEAMNISSRSVEMQRYRINKKIKLG